ncbi:MULTISPECIES: hypothetical protein [unclassified Devosia]|nr:MULTISPECIES: hypothetical protein [unclassified Devosia]
MIEWGVVANFAVVIIAAFSVALTASLFDRPTQGKDHPAPGE